MKKKNRVLRIGLLALVLTLVTASLVSGTFAKYVTTVNGTASVTVANWVAKLGADNGLNVATEKFSFDLLPTAYKNVKASDPNTTYKLIAPGLGGQFDLKYDTTGSQVARTVKITLTDENEFAKLPVSFQYSTNGTTWTAVPADGILLSTTFTESAAGDGTITVKWSWAYSVNADADVIDTAHGRAHKTYGMDVKFEAIQVEPTV